jgi:uncharacterized protein (TIGR02145 family)
MIMKKALNLLLITSAICGLGLIQGCKKDPVLPVVSTSAVTEVTINSAISGGNITSDGNTEITARGICWNTGTEPTIADSKTSDGTGSGEFTSNITGLVTGTTYTIRAYATNEVGTAYGEEISFTTKVADVDGNQYNIVKIGTQVWMVENLKTTKYNDNSAIPNVTGNAAWVALTTPGYAWYSNDAAYYKPISGALYNWHAVKTGKLCPTGWHVPTDADFNALEIGLGLPQAQADVWGWRGTDHGKQLKNTTGWNAGENGTNTSGFSAIPGGYRYYADGTFASAGTIGYWWSATEHDAARGWYRRLDGNNNGVYKASTDKKAGKSVRCIKN